MAAEDASRETNSMNAIDTNVFVYAFDSDEPVRPKVYAISINVR
jgi:hypothetical protein